MPKEKTSLKDEIFTEERLNEILVEEQMNAKEKEKWLKEQGLL